MNKNKAIFFDRDGVLNADNDFITDINQVIFYKETPEIISFCRNLGFKIFIITNQAIIARGMISEDKLIELNKKYIKFLNFLTFLKN